MQRASIVTVFALVSLTACASGGSGGGGSTGGGRNLIVAEDLTGITGNAYDAVQRLRPRWLQARSGGTEDLPATFVNGQHRGDYQALSSVPVTDIESIRYLAARDATTLYGTGYPGGIIEVTTR